MRTVSLPELELWKRAAANLSPADLGRVLLSDSPMSIIAIDHFRSLATAKGSEGRACTVDRFVFGKGTPDERHATKVNGLPYRPRGVDWPRDYEGRALTFLAQFCFADSKDHIGDLPGDVLVIFMRTHGSSLSGPAAPLIDPYDDINSLVFEWYPLGLRDLIDEPYPEAPSFEFPICFAVRHRTTDYVEQEVAIAALAQSIGDLGLSKPALRSVFCHPGMKIGGSPFWLHAPDRSLKGRFIAGFCGVGVPSECPFPWVNESAQLSLGESSDASNMLLIRDGACINFFLTEDGSIDWDAQYDF